MLRARGGARSTLGDQFGRSWSYAEDPHTHQATCAQGLGFNPISRVLSFNGWFMDGMCSLPTRSNARIAIGNAAAALALAVPACSLAMPPATALQRRQASPGYYF